MIPTIGFDTYMLGSPVPQMFVADRVLDGEALNGVPLPAVLDVVAIIIIDGIILLTEET